MSPVQIDPVFWSTSDLVRYGEEVIHEMALTAVGTVASHHFLIGRCLVAMKLGRWYENYGCSSIMHYANAILGLSLKEARRYYRVALDLSWLPALSSAAALGQIPWGKLREISRKASEETETLWIALAKKHTYSEIQRLVARTEKDGWPVLEDETEPELEQTELRCHFSPEMTEMLEQVRRKLSQEAGRPLSVSEVFSQLCAERLVKGHPDEKLTRAVEKSVKSRRAYRQMRDQYLVQQARELAGDLGLQDPAERPARGAGGVPGEATASTDALGEGGDAADCPARGVDDAADNVGCELSATTTLRAPARVLAAVYEKAQLSACPGVPELKLVHRAADVPLNSRLKFNPTTRLATPAQREELLRRDGYRCCVPGCHHNLWLEAHHLIEYCLGGPTDWKHMRMVCTGCHRNIHCGLLKISLNADGSLTFTDRLGRDLRRAQDMEVARWLNAWQGWRGGRDNCHLQRVLRGAWDKIQGAERAKTPRTGSARAG